MSQIFFNNTYEFFINPTKKGSESKSLKLVHCEYAKYIVCLQSRVGLQLSADRRKKNELGLLPNRKTEPRADKLIHFIRLFVTASER